MQYRLFSFLLSFVLVFFLPVLSWAQGTGDGIYKGTMDVIKVKGKTYEPRPAIYEIKEGKVLCDFPKIGKMPGKILIELPVVSFGEGQLRAEPGTEAGVMKMPMGIRIKLRLNSLEDALIREGTLSFTLSVSGKFMGADFPTVIHFSGIAQ